MHSDTPTMATLIMASRIVNLIRGIESAGPSDGSATRRFST